MTTMKRTSMQEVILDRMQGTLVEVDLMPTYSYGYANRGFLYGLDKATLDPVITVHFDFQTAYFSLKVEFGERDREGVSENVTRMSTIGHGPGSSQTSQVLARFKSLAYEAVHRADA